MRIRSFVIASLVAAAVVPVAGAHVINDWNLIVLNNLQNNSQDIEGRTWVGGNFTSSGSPTVAKNLTPASNFAGITTLAVVGNVSVGNINQQSGNLRYGGTFSGNFNANGGGNRAQDGSLAAQAPSFASGLSSISSFYQTLTTNSTVTLPSGGQPGAVTYNASPVNGLAVFSVSAANVFNSNLIQQMNLNVNGATAIVINVSGTTVNFTNGNMTGAWTSSFARANVIWNFFEANTITLDRNFNGALLAPNAHLTNSTAIDGSVFVRSFNQSGEVHLPNFRGFIPAPGAMALLAGAGVLASRRRRAVAA
jgi:choice-of-anchor A domain-containing protein